MTRIRRHALVAGSLALAAGLLALGASQAEQPAAGDIRSRLTPELIAQHCIANGVGSHVEGTFMLGSGERVRGPILCSADDMTAPVNVAGGRHHHHDDDDDDDEAFEDHEDH